MFKALWYFHVFLEWFTQQVSYWIDWCRAKSPDFDDWVIGADLERQIRLKTRHAEVIRGALADESNDDRQRQHYESQLRGIEEELGFLDEHLDRWASGTFRRVRRR